MEVDQLTRKFKQVSTSQIVGLLLLTVATIIASIFIYAQVDTLFHDIAKSRAERKTKELADRCAHEAGARSGPLWEGCMFANALKD